MDVTTIDIETISKYCFNNVFRTTTEKSGFVVLDFGTNIDSYKLRRIMVDLKVELSKLTKEVFQKTLTYQWLVRFDQQASTRYHIDNAGDQSFLMLGYEPTDVESELFLADYVQFSLDNNTKPSDYFDKYNPLFNDNESLLAPYITKATPFRNDTYKIVLINNSNSKSGGETLGMLHMASITTPNPNVSRVVNSIMLRLDSFSHKNTSEAIHEKHFITTDLVSK